MRKLLKIYIVWLSVLTGILALLGLIFFKTFLSEYYLPVYWFLLLLFYVIHAISQSIIVLADKKRPFNIGNVYLISFAIKFLSYLAFLIIYLVISESITMTFALVFFLLYLIYTVFDVRAKIHFSKTYPDKIEKSD
jgi:hypothetical protein